MDLKFCLIDFNQLKDKGGEIYANIGSTLNAQTISEKYPAIFEWLDLFDTNIYVISRHYDIDSRH